MKTYVTPTLLVQLLVVFSITPAKAQVSELETDNGLPFHFYRLEESSQINIQVSWPTDWAVDNTKNAAVPYLGSQLMLQGGTEDLSPAEIVESFQDLNAQATVNSLVDTVRGILLAPKDSIEEAVEIANQVLSKPQFSEQWLSRLKGAMVSSQEQNNRLPQKLMSDVLAYHAIAEEHLAQSISLVDSQLIAQISQDELLQWHGQTFTLDNATVVIVGALTENEAKGLVAKLLSQLPGAGKVHSVMPQTGISQKTILLHAPDLNTSYLGVFGLLPPTSIAGEFEDAVASVLLGQGENSELFRAMRTELRSSYAFNAGASNFFRDLRFLQMFGEVNTQQLVQAKTTVLKTYTAFLSQDEYSSAPTIANYFAQNLESASGNSAVVAGAIMESVLDGYEPSRGTRLASGFGAVTSRSLKTRINSSFPQLSGLVTIAVSPDANALPGACVITSPQAARGC